jgi:Ca-activated chloride channel family protein
MNKAFFPKTFLTLALSVFTLPVFLAFSFTQTKVAAQASATPGSLTVLDGKGQARSLCPLKHTDVKAEISGFISRVVVTQHFENPFKEKIEAVYAFPLPQNAAVDDMTMIIGRSTGGLRSSQVKRADRRFVGPGTA